MSLEQATPGPADPGTIASGDGVGGDEPPAKSAPSRFLRALTDRLAADPAVVRVGESLRSGGSGTLDGLWGSAFALGIAAARSRLDERPLLVALAHPGQLNEFQDDLRLFTGRSPFVFPHQELGDVQPDRGERRGKVAGVAGESFGRRLALVKLITGPDPPSIILTTIQALMQPVPSKEVIDRNSVRLQKGSRVSVDALIAWLEKTGWQRRDAVEIAGEYSLRGGILDVFPIDSPDPWRLEFFGDEVESIREFSVESQRSLRELQAVALTSMNGLEPPNPAAAANFKGAKQTGPDPRGGTLVDLLPPTAWVALVEPGELREQARQFLERAEQAALFDHDEVRARLVARPSLELSGLPSASLDVKATVHCESVERLGGDVTKVSEELDRIVGDSSLLVACHNDAEVKRLGEIMAGSKLGREGRLKLEVSRLTKGFRWTAGNIVAISDNELFRRTEVRRLAPKRRYQSKAIDSFVDLQPGDYVVHLSHGIGIFRGMKMLEKNDQLEEHLTIEFADETLVYVPASKIDLIQKYVGATTTAPRLSKIGGVAWEKKKAQVQRAVADFASDLLEVQAARQTRPGHAFPSDSEWMNEFEEAFPYTETADQLTSMSEIKEDMESTRPMDRLLCGDVGFGKTELAMRAAFKAVDSGKQVAVLVPTTVLAQQHLRTFRERMAEFPFTIGCLTRFETPKEKRKTIADATAGKVDVLIGTHRILSEDVKFHDLGLVIVDEEQRFGVEHKERLKRFRSTVDVLTLSATPIPRTLHQSLLGIRDISNLETAPTERQPIETRIARFDPQLVRHAIVRELNREGQIYFVHNRVKDLDTIKRKILDAVPEVRIATIHGQMTEENIEAGMMAFLERRADLLLATTIIESGLDIPSANTMFINEGDHYGLAELHQLRGRVGRSDRRAYCYVLVDEHRMVNPDAQRRLKAIEEYSNLGAGFKIALRDLEIRGAGNILGVEQSGHIAAIGYELYCHMLENAVRTLKKQPMKTHLDVTIELPWKALFPPDWFPGERFRIDAYRRLSRIRDLGELDEFRTELADRFGDLPAEAANLVDIFELRLLAQIWQIEAIRPDEQGWLTLTYRHKNRMKQLGELRPGQMTILDDRQAIVRIKKEYQSAEAYCRVLKRLLQPS